MTRSEAGGDNPGCACAVVADPVERAKRVRSRDASTGRKTGDLNHAHLSPMQAGSVSICVTGRTCSLSKSRAVVHNIIVPVKAICVVQG
ncbi:MAG: hypothetical protein KAS57_07355 [Gammaproteobacteria bacterium]|nr:hypothetical protein [Gammaproteobacteria bacterium]